jgi:gliding motility associated protien GldN
LPVKTSTGDKVGENVLFWIYYPDARELLAREKVFNDQNDGAPMTWEDVFEMRYFSSYIYKTSNVKDLRLQDQFTGRDLLLEADKIKQEIFNLEHDLWTY